MALRAWHLYRATLQRRSETPYSASAWLMPEISRRRR